MEIIWAEAFNLPTGLYMEHDAMDISYSAFLLVFQASTSTAPHHRVSVLLVQCLTDMATNTSPYRKSIQRAVIFYPTP